MIYQRLKDRASKEVSIGRQTQKEITYSIKTSVLIVYLSFTIFEDQINFFSK